MALSSITGFAGMNVPGACWIDYVRCDGINTFPSELGGNLEDDITLLGGYAWTRIVSRRFSLQLRERWTRVNGAPVARAELRMALQKDDLNKLPGLWELYGERHVILLRNRNDQVLCMGTKNEGCKFDTVERDSGAEAGDPSGYDLVWTLGRRTPIPFYQGPPPTVSAASGSTVVVVDGIDDTGAPYDEAVITIL